VATIVVGVEDSFRAQDAVALAGDLAEAANAEVVAVSAYRFDDDPAAHYNLAIRASLQETTERVLDRACQPLSHLRVHRVAVPDPSPARALIRAATEASATLIVVGSSHGEFTGRLRPGSTAWRLLQGAPCAVALAPQGYRMRPHLTFNRVTAGFDGSAGGYAALSAASRIAQATGQSLRVVSVFAPDALAPPWLHAAPGFLRVSPDAEHAARMTLERAVADHPGAEPAFLVGDPGRELARESEVSDLLVIGSRGYGPEGALVLGGVSDHVMRTAACPALIVPNGVETPLAELFPTCGKLRIDSTDAPGSRAFPLPVG
jgi:nucleotide-binding universal stress UspA family protein